MFGCDHSIINPLNAELNSICHLLASLGAHHILHVSRIRVKGTYLGKQIMLSYVFPLQLEQRSRNVKTRNLYACGKKGVELGYVR
jgi:hypothetical protein